MISSYLPVQHIYKEVILEEMTKKTAGKVFFFDDHDAVASCEGSIQDLKEVEGKGWFVIMDPPARVRIDRIITLFGKPGAAYDEYDSFANACMNCAG